MQAEPPLCSFAPKSKCARAHWEYLNLRRQKPGQQGVRTAGVLLQGMLKQLAYERLCKPGPTACIEDRLFN
eukprot:1161950-Pelagomonas_calceolata.AAC.4